MVFLFKADVWNAIATFCLVFLTSGLAIAAFSQIKTSKSESKKSRTLVACEKYDLDPVLDKSLRAIRAHRLNSTSDFGKDLKLDITNVLNYLDGIAIGIDQDMYIDSLAKDHLEVIVRDHVRDYLNESTAKNVGVDPDNFKFLKRMAERWAITTTVFRA